MGSKLSSRIFVDTNVVAQITMVMSAARCPKLSFFSKRIFSRFFLFENLPRHLPYQEEGEKSCKISSFGPLINNRIFDIKSE